TDPWRPATAAPHRLSPAEPTLKGPPMPLAPRRNFTGAIAVSTAAMLAVTACGADDELETLNIDFATYNPLSLVILENGWLEEELQGHDVEVEWTQSHGSNRANENLRAGNIHVGSTAGAAALLNRSVGADIHTILIESQ